MASESLVSAVEPSSHDIPELFPTSKLTEKGFINQAYKARHDSIIFIGELSELEVAENCGVRIDVFILF